MVHYFEETESPLTNVSACARDDVRALLGRHAGFLAHLEKEMLEVITTHCVIHHQHLIVELFSGVLHETL